jgi:opacity protein-like surface antigen
MMTAAAGAFALPAFQLSAGGGALMGGNWTKSYSKGDMPQGYKNNTARFVAGAYGFFDATFAEFALAYEGQTGKVTNIKAQVGDTWMDKSVRPEMDDKPITSHQIVLDLLGKYPFQLSQMFTLYPALGLSLRLPFAGNKQSEHAQKQDWGLGLKFGAGLDTNLTSSLYLRTELLADYEIAADTNIEIGQLNNAKYKNTTSISDNYNIGAHLRVGVGYRF